MLKILRKKGVAKKILWVVAVIIILSFGVFGTAYRQNSRAEGTFAGKIFGKKISIEQYETALQHARTQAIMRYGENFSKISQFLNLEGEAWDRLILLEEAQKRKIKVSDQDVIKTIQGFDFFKKDKQFSPEIYQKISRYVFESQPRDFEEGVRESLVFQKLFDMESSVSVISEEELRKEYQKKNEKAQISYLLFAADDYLKDVPAGLTEAQNYYNAHKEDFRMPPAVNIESIEFLYPPDAKPDAKSVIDDTAKKVSEELKHEKDLTKTAEKYNLKINESGFFSRENPNLKLGWPFEVLQKAFLLDKGEISDVASTAKGGYILRLKDIKDTYIPEFEEANEKIFTTLKSAKAKELAKTKAEETLKKIKDSQNNPSFNFADFAKDLHLNLQTTESFARGQYLQTVGMSQEFQDAAFNLTEQNKISGAIEIAKGYAILHLDNLTPINEEQYTKEKDTFRKTVLDVKKNEAFTNFLSKLRSKANLKDNTAKLKKTNQDF